MQLGSGMACLEKLTVEGGNAESCAECIHAGDRGPETLYCCAHCFTRALGAVGGTGTSLCHPCGVFPLQCVQHLTWVSVRLTVDLEQIRE